LQKSIKFIKKI